MATERIAELRRFISTITQPQIRPFIDLKKLCPSGTYSLAVQMAIEHAATHGDFAYLNNLMTLIDGTPYAGDFIAQCRSRVSFVVTDDKPRKLKKSDLQNPANPHEHWIRRVIANGRIPLIHIQ